MMRVDFKDDITPRLKKLRHHSKGRAVDAGRLRGGRKIVQLTLTVPPKPPVRDGRLRESWIIELKNREVERGRYADSSAPKAKDRKALAVKWASKYARYQHEGMRDGPGVKHPISGTRIQLQPGPASLAEGGVGGLFLSQKLERFPMAIMKEIAKGWNEEMQKA